MFPPKELDNETPPSKRITKKKVLLCIAVMFTRAYLQQTQDCSHTMIFQLTTSTLTIPFLKCRRSSAGISATSSKAAFINKRKANIGVLCCTGRVPHDSQHLLKDVAGTADVPTQTLPKAAFKELSHLLEITNYFWGLLTQLLLLPDNSENENGACCTG